VPSSGPHCIAMSVRSRPVPPKNNERDVVRHEERRNPKRRNPVRRTQVRRCAMNRSENDRSKQVQGAHDVEEPHEQPGASCLAGHRWNRGDCQHSGQQIAERCRVGKRRWNAGVGGARCQEHQTEVTKRVQEQDRAMNRAGLQPLNEVISTAPSRTWSSSSPSVWRSHGLRCPTDSPPKRPIHMLRVPCVPRIPNDT